MKNKALQNLRRNLFRQALNYQAGGTFIEDKGVHTFMALWHFFVDPSDENALQCVTSELQHEIEKLEQKGISRDKWPKFLQSDDWRQKTYEKFGVSYPGKNDVFRSEC